MKLPAEGETIFDNIKRKMIAMKKFFISALISSMLLAPAGALAAEDSGAKLSGVYSSCNEVKVIADDIVSVEWSRSRTETGTYAAIAGETGDTYTIKFSDAGYWIKAVVTDSEGNKFTTEPRAIEKAWNQRRTPSNISGAVAQTPEKYSFTIDGMEFALLDVTEDEESKFLAIAKKSIGYIPKMEIGKQSEFIYKVIGFLNNLDEVEEFYNSDNASLVNAGYKEGGYIGNLDYTQLPESVLASINNNQVWRTEPISSGQPKERVYRGGITIPSYNDMLAYSDRIGWKNDIKKKEDEKDPDVYISFLLRTPGGTGKVLYANADVAGNISDTPFSEINPSLALRPMFYLDRDFFINNKPENPGQEVLNVMWSEYSKPELLKIYTQEELTALGYIDFTVENLSVSSNEDGYYAEVSVSSRLAENKEIVILVAAYDADGLLSGVNIDTVTCAEGDNSAEIKLHGLDGGSYSSAMAVIIDSAQNPAPVYKAVFTK